MTTGIPTEVTQMPTIEADVLAILRPGGLLTADTIAYNLELAPWRVRRALDTLRRSGDAFQNRRAAWQISTRQRCPDRRTA